MNERASGRLAAMRRVGMVAALVAGAMSFPGTARPQNGPSMVAPAPGMCLGHWVGAGRNAGGPAWTIEMNVTAVNGPVCGHIEYPSLGCGGALINCTTRSGQTTFVEAYDHNAGRCAPDGTIVARCEPAAMHWTWIGEEVVRAGLARR